MSIESTLEHHFDDLKDPRRKNKNIRHSFNDILVIMICAIIGGADDCVAIARYGVAKKHWFDSFLDLENGIPSHDVFNNVLRKMCVEEFQKCFVSWVKSISLLIPGEVVPIDGKTIRRSHDDKNDLKAAHIVSAWACENRMVLGQVKTEEKSNEITAIPKLLEMLELNGCLVTIDAMGCQKKIVEKIVEKDADYLIAVKDNQPKLFSEIKEIFSFFDEKEYQDIDSDYSESSGYSHGRDETRKCRVIYAPNLSMKDEWQNLSSIVRIESTRIIKGKISCEYRYYITSSCRDADYLLNSTRKHWAIENSLHWVLDVGFREDDSRFRSGNGAANFSILRHIATNLLKKNKDKLGMKNKRLRAGWDDAYMEELLLGLQGL